jgi:SAM-dependent methyltransferase
MKKKDDYVLGTHDEEIARLGLQHRVWRPVVLQCWQRAGIRAGLRVVDVGAGPGYVTVDLAEIVGPAGEVMAVERSPRFLAVTKAMCESRGFANVKFQEADLMEQDIEGAGFDAAWCRWVASFVARPGELITKIARSLRPGGIAIFHEYFDYGAWRIAPRRPAVEGFVAEVMQSWRDAGGEPDIALSLPPLLREAGLRVKHATPHVFTVSPNNFVWQWPASFVEVNLRRLTELGRVKEEWATTVRREFEEATADDTSLMTTPLLLEIVAVKE